MVISHNLQAMNANRQYNTVNKNLRTSTEKLSSGYRINRAADDAAGLSISEKMRWQIRGLNRADSNIQDGISYVQVADGALSEIDNMLHRMNELAVQAANDTNTPQDRAAINSEINEIKAEISRVFNDTEFNTKKIWKGEVDPWIETTAYRDVPAVNFSSTYSSTKVTNQNKYALPKDGYTLTADATGITASWKGYNGNTYTSEKIPWPNPLEGSQSFSLKNYLDTAAHPEVTGIDMKVSYNVNENSNLNDVITAINNKKVSSYVSTNPQVKMYDYNGKSVYVPGVTMYASIDYEKYLKSGVDMDKDDTVFIEGTKNAYGYANVINPANTSPANNFSFEFNMQGYGTVNSTVTGNTYYANVGSNNARSQDKNIWWKWEKDSQGDKYMANISYSTTPNNGSLNAINNAAVNDSVNKGLSRSVYGGSESISFNLNAGGTKVGSMSMYIAINSGESTASIKNRLSKIVGVDIYNNAGSVTLGSYTDISSSSNTVKEPYIDRQFDPDKTLSLELNIQSGATQENGILISYEDMSLDFLGLSDIDVLNYKNASQAIDYIGQALDIVSNERSSFGAYQNRLEHARNVDQYTSENTQSAESRIRDTDMAEEMVSYSKENILSQIGQSMMTQANSSAQSVLSLLS